MGYPKNTINVKLIKNTINTECIASQDDFYRLKEEWNKLWKKSRESHPFISWEWAYTWWEVFANPKDELMIITVYRGGALIGIAPFYIKQHYFGRSLMFLGEGEPRKEAVATHYLDLICKDIDSEQVIDAVANYLKNTTTWSHCQFSFVLDQSYLFLVFSKFKMLSFSASLGYQYKINLKHKFDDLYNSLGKSTRRSFRLKRNRMQKQAPLTLLSLDIDDDIESSFDILEKLHAYRQQLQGKKNTFSEPRYKQFHLSLVKRLKGTDNVQLRALKHGEEIIACALNYVSSHNSNRGIYSYASGFKSSDDKRFSPMFVFDLLDFEHSINNKYTHYDLLSDGEESSYKDKYKANRKAVSRVYWFTLSPLGLLRYTLIKGRSFASMLKRSLRKT